MAAVEETRINGLTDENMEGKSSADGGGSDGAQRSSRTEEEGVETSGTPGASSQVYGASSLPLVYNTETAVKTHPLVRPGNRYTIINTSDTTESYKGLAQGSNSASLDVSIHSRPPGGPRAPIYQDKT